MRVFLFAGLGFQVSDGLLHLHAGHIFPHVRDRDHLLQHALVLHLALDQLPVLLTQSHRGLYCAYAFDQVFLGGEDQAEAHQVLLELVLQLAQLLLLTLPINLVLEAVHRFEQGRVVDQEVTTFL